MGDAPVLTNTSAQMSGGFADISRKTLRTAVFIHYIRLQLGFDPIFEWEKTADGETI